MLLDHKAPSIVLINSSDLIFLVIISLLRGTVLILMNLPVMIWGSFTVLSFPVGIYSQLDSSEAASEEVKM